MRFIVILFALAAAAFAGADEDWAKITALDAGPGVQPKNAAEARDLSLAHTAKQEKSLRDFLAAHAGDERTFEARLRLSRVLVLRAEFASKPQPEEAATLLVEAEKSANSNTRRAELDFARLANRMRELQGRRPTDADRRATLAAARDFQKAHPKDRRLAWVLTEVSNLFEGDSKTKTSLLADAKALTTDKNLRAQIADDEKRHKFLGSELPLKFTALDGNRVDSKAWRGQPVVVLFFATWSEPSKSAFATLQRAAIDAGVPLVAFSLDEQRAPLDAFLKERKTFAPIGWDGLGWESPFIQSLGINALPAAWLLDKEGKVRTLDALEAPDELLKKLSR